MDILIPYDRLPPAPARDEVVVEVAFASVSVADLRRRQGIVVAACSPDVAYERGRAVAGRVISIGTEVDPAWLGRVVVAHATTGGAGEAAHAIANVSDLTSVPPSLAVPAALALLDDGPNACALADLAAIRMNERVMVEAAASGVGSLLVQLAAASGAFVIGLTAGQKTLALVRSLGADVVVDSSQPDWSKQVKLATDGRGVDLVFDSSHRLLDLRSRRPVVHSADGSAEPTATWPVDVSIGARRRLQRMFAYATADRLSPVTRIFSLDQAAEARAILESDGAVGSTLLLVKPGLW